MGGYFCVVSTDHGVSLDISRLRETGSKIIYSTNLPLYISGGKDAIPRIISNFVEIIQIMAFNTKTYKKTHSVTKTEFIDAIKGINKAESVTGVKYINIELVNGIICGIRESTKEPFGISVDSLFQAFCDIDKFTATALKPYVNRVQSPALAVLISSNLVIPNEIEEKPKEGKKEETIKENTTNIIATPKKKRHISSVNCGVCGKPLFISRDSDKDESLTCPNCGNYVYNPNYVNPFPESKKSKTKKYLFFIIGIIFIVGLIAYINNQSSKYIINGELQGPAKTEAITLIKHRLDNPSSYNGNGWVQGNYDSNSDTERYFMIHKFTVKNSYGIKEEKTATIIFDKDGHVTRVEM